MLSTRLFPGRSGMSRVCEISTATNPRCVAAWRSIRPAVRISSRHHEKWRAGNERAGVLVDVIEVLSLCQHGRHTEVAAERLTELTGWLGDDHVGFGTDMNGLATNALIKSYVDLRQVLDHLQSRGMPERRIHELAIGNYARVLRRALQGSEARSLAIARRSRRGATVIGRHVGTGPITKPYIFSVRVFRGGFS
jgi:Membrane dipeptidase (Peptidase family M19)